eukprot:2357557-Amphidinium_carterae.1
MVDLQQKPFRRSAARRRLVGYVGGGTSGHVMEPSERQLARHRETQRQQPFTPTPYQLKVDFSHLLSTQISWSKAIPTPTLAACQSLRRLCAMPGEVMGGMMLTTMSLSYNRLQRSLPDPVRRTNCVYLDVEVNQFRGSLPEAGVGGLAEFKGDVNRFTGALTDEVLQWKRFMRVSGNHLAGSLLPEVQLRYLLELAIA